MKRFLSLVSVLATLTLIGAACRPLETPETPTMLPSETPSLVPPTETLIPELTETPTAVPSPTADASKEIWTGRASYFGYPNFILEFDPAEWESKLVQGVFPALAHKNMSCQVDWLREDTIATLPIEVARENTLPFRTGIYQVRRFNLERLKKAVFYLSDQGTVFSVQTDSENMVDLDACIFDAEKVLVTLHFAPLVPTPTPMQSDYQIWMWYASIGGAPDFILEFPPYKWQKDLLYGSPVLAHKNLPTCILGRFAISSIGIPIGSQYTRTEDSSLEYRDGKFQVVRLFKGDEFAGARYVGDQGTDFYVVADERMAECVQDAEAVLITFRTFGTPMPPSP